MLFQLGPVQRLSRESDSRRRNGLENITKGSCDCSRFARKIQAITHLPSDRPRMVFATRIRAFAIPIALKRFRLPLTFFLRHSSPPSSFYGFWPPLPVLSVITNCTDFIMPRMSAAMVIWSLFLLFGGGKNCNSWGGSRGVWLEMRCLNE